MNGSGAAVRILRAGATGIPLTLVGEEKFGPLTALLSGNYPVQGLRVPLPQSSSGTTSVEQLALHCLAALRSVQPQGPYRLVGYSFGGLIAYEMASRLVAAGQQVRLLGLLDTPNPRFHQQLSAAEAQAVRALYLADRRGKYLRTLRSGRLDRLGADACRFLVRRLRSITAPVRAAIVAAPPDIHTLWHAYAPGPYPGDLLLVRAEGRDGEFGADATMGWQRCVTGAIHVEHTCGLHEAMLDPPHVESLAARLNPWLEATEPADDA